MDAFVRSCTPDARSDRRTNESGCNKRSYRPDSSGCPGVNTLTQLELTLTELRSEGLAEIKTAFDMDFSTNHHVQNGYNNLLQLLGDMGFRYGTYLWDPAYKGLDDYIWEYLFRKKRSQ